MRRFPLDDKPQLKSYQSRFREFCGFKPVVFFIFLILPFCVALWWMGGSSSTSMATPFIINASAKHTATVIFLHGLGDTGQGWSQMFSMMKSPYIKYVCPTANIMPVTLNAGLRMPSWFDIRGLGPDSDQDEAGIIAASDMVQSIIADEEKKGIPRNRIVIGGFSQGGAVTLYSALTSQKPLAGIVALSTWLPLHKSFPQALKGNQNTPILQCHGEADPLVRFDFGSLTGQMLKSFNPNHEFKSYADMGHSSCDQELQDVRKFLEKVLPPV